MQDENAAEPWIADYPPWFAEHWIKPANCKRPQERADLLHLLRSIEDGKPDHTRLIVAKINPNISLATEGEKTETLLEWAAKKTPHPDCLRALLAASADPRAGGVLTQLLSGRNATLLPEFLAAGANPNAPYEGVTPLARAVIIADTTALKLLVAAGAAVDAPSHWWWESTKPVHSVTPLMLAAFRDSHAALKLLLAAGANPNARDSNRRTAIDWAATLSHRPAVVKIAQLLKKAGAADTELPPPSSPPPNFRKRAASPDFKTALAAARKLTGTKPLPIELEDGPLPGGKAFLINEPDGPTLLEKLRPLAPNTFLFLSQDITDNSGHCLALLPTTDYPEAITALETPVGQSLTPAALIQWLHTLEKTDPFTITHLQPDLLRATFHGPLHNPTELAAAIQKICPDVIHHPLPKIASELEARRELYLWWD